MRTALAALRSHAGSDGQKSLVSPLNRDPAVVRGRFREPVKLRDITLRTIEQMGIVRSPAERREILVGLAEAGVDEIMVSAVRRGHELKELRADAEAVAKVNPNCLLLLGSVNTEDDLLFVKEAGYGGAQVWMAPFMGDATAAVAGAVYKRAWEGRRWDDLRFPKSEKDQTERALRLVELSAKHGIKLSCSILMLSYATLDYVASFSRAAAAAGAFDIMLGDHSSAAAPETWEALASTVAANAPGISISVHPHDMFGLATACAIAGLKGGATTAEVSINGITDGPSQADLAHTVAALQILYGVRTNVDMTRLTALSRLCEGITGVESERYRGLTGKQVFEISGPGDEYVQEYKVDKLFHTAIDPTIVGNEMRLVVSSATGPWSVWDKLEELGFSDLNRDQVARIYAVLREELSKLRRALSDEEVRRIALGALERAAAE